MRSRLRPGGHRERGDLLQSPYACALGPYSSSRRRFTVKTCDLQRAESGWGFGRDEERCVDVAGRQCDTVIAAVLVLRRTVSVRAAAVIGVVVEAAFHVGAFAVHMLAVVRADSRVAAKVEDCEKNR